MKREKRRCRLAVLFCIAAMLLEPCPAYAREATVTFGSNYYRATDNEEIPIGVYINAESEIGVYHVELSYDTARLTYLGGGDGEENGTITLEGSGLRSQVKYMLRFRTRSGGTAEIAVKAAEIKTAESAEQAVESLAVEELLTAPVYIDGEDTAASSEQEADVTEEAEETDGVPVTGQVTILDTEYAIVDTRSYLPKQTDWKYGKTQGVFDEQNVTWLTNPSETVLFLYLMNEEKQLSLYAYSESAQQLYPCNTMVMNGTKFYYMSPSVCGDWPDGLTLDTVRSQFIVYAMDLAGQCGFYRLTAANELVEWNQNAGEALVHRQTVKLVLIFVSAFVLMTATAIAAGVIERSRRKKRGTQRNVHTASEFVEDLSLEVTEDEIRRWYLEAQEDSQNKTPVIQLDHVTMKFRIATQNVSGIKEYLIQLIRRKVSYRELLALDDVSLRIYQGEIVGIIGTNGSGKSTLLKLVSGALEPTAGSVIADRGKVQLLTIGTGFDTELTARENVYLNGAIIGYTKEFIDTHYAEIVAFAELEGFMEEKVKNFSSGMVQRLGFAIATAGETAEILILDEVLSVGDEFFRKKSLTRVTQMIQGGATVLLVSHSAATIVENCTKAVWIEKGVLRMVGEPREVCEAYRRK